MYDDKKGFGFIRPHVQDIPDLFTHSSDIEKGTLTKNQVVSFVAVQGKNKDGSSQYKAKNVRVEQ